MKVVTTRRLAVALALLFVAAACSDNNAGRVSFSVTSRSGVAGVASVGAVAISPDLTAGQACAGLLVPAPAGTTDELCITSAALILKKVELKRIETATCDAIPDNEDCDEFETGSVFVPQLLEPGDAARVPDIMSVAARHAPSPVDRVGQQVDADRRRDGEQGGDA